MKKFSTIKLLGLATIGYILFSSFKKKGALSSTVSVYDFQENVPTGTVQVFSKVGTTVYDANFSEIYKYDTAGIGMTKTGNKGDQMYQVIIGQSFMNGTNGFVFKNDVTTL